MNSIDLRRLDIWQCSECHPQHFLLSPKEPCKHKSLRWRCPGRDAACITAKGRYKHKRNCIYYKEALKDSVLTNALYGNGGTLSAETLNAFSEQQRIHNSPYSKKLFRKKLPKKLKNLPIVPPLYMIKPLNHYHLLPQHKHHNHPLVLIKNLNYYLPHIHNFSHHHHYKLLHSQIVQ